MNDNVYKILTTHKTLLFTGKHNKQKDGMSNLNKNIDIVIAGRYIV